MLAFSTKFLLLIATAYASPVGNRPRTDSDKDAGFFASVPDEIMSQIGSYHGNTNHLDLLSRRFSDSNVKNQLYKEQYGPYAHFVAENRGEKEIAERIERAPDSGRYMKELGAMDWDQAVLNDDSYAIRALLRIRGSRSFPSYLVSEAASEGKMKALEASITHGDRTLLNRKYAVAGPLHLAVYENQNLPTVQTLIEFGADVNSADFPNRATPLHIAAERGNVEIVDYLLKHGADPSLVDSAGNNALHYAASSNVATVNRLLQVIGVNERNEYGMTALHEAALSGTPETIDALIAAGADIEAVDKRGRTPLAWAVSDEDGTPGKIDRLISHGAAVLPEEMRHPISSLDKRVPYWNPEEISISEPARSILTHAQALRRSSRENFGNTVLRQLQTDDAEL